MKYGWGYISILIPFLGYGVSFNDLSERAYSVSEKMIQSNGRINTISFEKASIMASEPMSIETSSRRIKGDDPINSGTEYAVMVDYSLKNPSLRSAQEHEFELLKKGTKEEIAAQKGHIQIGLKRDWLQYGLEQERSSILVQKRDFSYKAYLAGEKKFKAGRLSQIELLRLDSEYRATLQEVSSALMEAEHAQFRLRETVMMKDEVIIDDMEFRFIESSALEDRLKETPLLKSLDNRIEALDGAIAIVRHSTVESVSIGVGITQEPTQNSVDFRLTIPLAFSSKNENKIAALMSERSAIVHLREVSKQKLQLSVAGLVEHLGEREERINVLRENEKHYETLFAMAQKGYDGGVMGQFEYLASKNAYYDARLRTLELKQSYIQEMAEIEEKIGRVW
ncbi:MAG: TolC family protein [Sulfuricurvum sp.]|uniref:TolC family protein n=1 Tax=Sulfuricurvum sp. TaxID=2025608 RepID=UPI0025FBAB2C|nr:TolC family protein [Sulfuricurvum sp.]MBV5320952.1 TolC family protein [Sulfuricurvum sp.]